MHRLKTRAQFQATMAGGTVSRTPHFALHRLALPAGVVASAQLAQSGDTPQAPQAPGLFALPAATPAAPWLGALVPKRWARRAVTRNAIRRQIYAVSAGYEARLQPQASYVVRLRAQFDRKQFISASSDALKRAVRTELELLFDKAAAQGAARGPAL